MANMIFHHPLPVNSNGKSGSQVRPYKMIEAFNKIGYKVHVVAGYGNERAKAVKTIKTKYNNGMTFDFIYSESSTLPTLLTEPHHLPTYPFLDFGFLKWAKRNSIPVGLFYRDIPWKFDFYNDLFPFWNRWFVTSQYLYDWYKYKKLIEYLFLPSHGMIKYLPSNWNIDKVFSLPPGVSDDKNSLVKRNINSKKVKVFYVGGVTPPAYNLRPLFQTVKGLEGINLTLCCREDEWENNRHYYNTNLNNTNIVHLSGEKLKRIYNETDIFVLIRESHSYLDFAMPVKVFESFGYGVPILTLKGSQAARFIEEEGIGWVVENIDEARNLLTYLKNNPNEIKIKRERTFEARKRHTWEARALQVAKTLTK